MIDFRELAKELFLILKSYSNDLILYDESGNRLYEPEEATRIFSQDLKLLVSVIEAGDNSCIRLYVSDSSQVSRFTNLIQTMRTCAVTANVLFFIRQMEGMVTPDKFASKDKITEDTRMNVCEGMYGTSHSSYLKLENAKVIVRHYNPVREGMVGARGRSIKTIFVENAYGERAVFPINSLIGARAYAQHVNQGGGFADAISSQIIRIAGDYQNLRKGMVAIEQNPNAVSNGIHLSVGIHEAIKTVRKTLVGLAGNTTYEEASKNIGQLNEGDDNSIDFIKSITNGKLSEDIMKSIARHVSAGVVTEVKDPTIDGFKDRDIDPSESGWAEGDDAGVDGVSDGVVDGGVSEGIQESLAIFESWMDSIVGLDVVAEEAADTEEEQIATPPAPLEDAPSVSADDQALAMISAINMAQEALSQAMRSHVDKFSTMPAHNVVAQFIIPAIQNSIIERKNAYDGLVNAVDLALNGGDQTALLTMLDVAATADGYSSFVDFAFSASIGEFIAPEQYGEDAGVIDVIADTVEMPDVNELENFDAMDAIDDREMATDAFAIDPILDDADINQLAEETGVVGKIVIGEKESFSDFKAWKEEASKLDGSTKTMFAVWVDGDDGEDVLAAKWDLSTDKGWVRPVTNEAVSVEERRDRQTFKAVIQEEEDDELLEDLANVIQEATAVSLIDDLKSMNQFDDNRDFYSAVSMAGRGDHSKLDPFLDKAAMKLGASSYSDFVKSKAQAIKDDYLADIDAQKTDDGSSNIIDLERLRRLSGR